MATVDVEMSPAMNGHVNGNGDMNGKEASVRFTSGLILPPPEIKCELC